MVEDKQNLRSDERWVALDQIRAVAAYMVFCWHFLHWSNGYPIPFEYTPDGHLH
jgi:peptidoglycan/LPS O-acetylase OafA/YrhL